MKSSGGAPGGPTEIFNKNSPLASLLKSSDPLLIPGSPSIVVPGHAVSIRRSSSICLQDSLVCVSVEIEFVHFAERAPVFRPDHHVTIPPLPSPPPPLTVTVTVSVGCTHRPAQLARTTEVVSVETLGVVNPKGGTGKTTTAVTLAAVAAERWPDVLLIDADETRSASEWMERAGDAARFAVAIGDDPAALARLREVSGYRLAVVDMPGARHTGELAALLRPPHSARPAVDALVMPTEPAALDLRVLTRAIREEVEPAGVPYRVLFCKVHPHPAAIARAVELAAELRTSGVPVLDAMVRRLLAHQDAANHGLPITAYGGRHDYARRGEREYRAVAAELFGGLLGLDWPTDEEES